MTHVNGTTTVITPEGTSSTWADVWAYRELLYFIVWRDLRVRYRQMALGATWAILQPFSTMVVFSLVFGLLAGMPSDGAPYPVFSYAGLVPWTYFAAAVAQGAGSLVGSQSLLAKVYFPRLIVPLAAIIVPLVDAAVSMVMMAVLMAWYGIAPGIAILTLPGFALLATVFAGAVEHLAVGVEREVSRRSLRGAVPHPVRVVRHTGGLSQFARARTLALVLRAQPDGHGGGRVPLGARRHAVANRGRGAVVHHGGGPDAVAEPPLFPAHGARVCRCPLTRRPVIRVSQLGKRYQLGRRPSPHLRDRIVENMWAAVRAVTGAPEPEDAQTLWALREVSFEVGARRSRRHHRPQRRGQVHAAEDPVAHHRADRGPRGDTRAAWGRCSRWGPASIPT